MPYDTNGAEYQAEPEEDWNWLDQYAGTPESRRKSKRAGWCVLGAFAVAAAGIVVWAW